MGTAARRVGKEVTGTVRRGEGVLDGELDIPPSLERGRTAWGVGRRNTDGPSGERRKE